MVSGYDYSVLIFDKKMTRYTAVRIDSWFLVDACISISIQYSPNELTVIVPAT